MKLSAAALVLALAGSLVLPGAALAQEGMPDPNTIPMQNNLFLPAEKTVVAGTTLTWVNLDPEDHDVITNDLTIISPLIKPGESWSYTFETPGTYAYVCDLHTGMEGVIVVAPPAPAAGEAETAPAAGEAEAAPAG
jgi:plastocyanin